MKKLLISLLFPLCLSAQKIGAAASMGITNEKKIIGEGMILLEKNNFILYPFTLKMYADMSNSSLPVIVEPRFGYKLGTWQLYGGFGYHLASVDGDTLNGKDMSKINGWKPGAGIIKRFGNLFVSTGISGKIATLQIGILGLK